MAELWVTTSPKQQALSEAIAYTIDYTDIGTPSGAGTVAVYDGTGADLSTTLLSGSASLAGNIVTLKLFTPVVVGSYRIISTVTISGNSVKGGIEVDVYSPLATQAISNSYATLAEFKHYAKVEASSIIDDNVIADMIEAASRYIDQETRRTFYARTETHYFSVPEGRELQLDDDLLSVTTLTNGDATVLTSSYYYLWPRNKSPYSSVVMKESSIYSWEMGSDGDTEYIISLVGSWGWSTTRPDDINLACLEIVKSMYSRRFGENTSGVATITAAGVVITPQDIPSAAWNIIKKYMRYL